MRSHTRHGFSLSEVMIAMSVFTVVAAIAMLALVALVKRNDHTFNTTAGVAELRTATDLITQAVRSSPTLPIVEDGGRTLIVAPPIVYYATVQGTDVVDNLRTPNILGIAGGRDTITFPVRSRQPATTWIMADACPSSAISALGSTFIGSANHPELDLDDMFSVGDSVSIPGTRYGVPITLVVRSITNTASVKSLRFTTALPTSPSELKIPNGTQIAASSGRRLKFSVQTNGELRYWRDDRVAASYTVIATNLTTQPRANPESSSSAVEPCFNFIQADRTVQMNLQRLPAGRLSGRTEIGIRTWIHARTRPSEL